MPVDALVNIIKNTKNTPAYQVNPYYYAAYNIAADRERLGLDEPSAPANPLDDPLVKAQRDAQELIIREQAKRSFTNPDLAVDRYRRANPELYTDYFVPNTTIPRDSERGQELAAVQKNIDATKEMLRYRPSNMPNDATRAAQEYIMGAEEYKKKLQDYVSDEEYRADKAANAAAEAAQQRRQYIDPTETAYQLDQLKARRDELRNEIQRPVNAVVTMGVGGNAQQMLGAQKGELFDARQRELERLELAIREMEGDLDAVERDRQMAVKYTSLMDNPDFEAKSQYTPHERRAGTVLNDPSGEGIYRETELQYEMANGNQQAVNQYNRIRNNGGKFDGLAYMTDEERRIYNYLYDRDMNSENSLARDDPETYGESGKYINEILPTLNARMRAAEEEKMRQYSKEDPVGMSVATVLTSPLKAASYAGQLGDFAATGKVDQNAAYNRYAYTSSAVLSTVAREIERNWGKTGSFAYNTGMSMADNLWQMFLTGGAAGEGAMLAIMGTGAAADAVIAAKDRGLTDAQAFALGTATGAIEAITEKIGFDNLYGYALKGDTAALKAILSQVLSEGSEEFAGSIMDNLADMLIAGIDSEHAQRVRQLVASGMSEKDAVRSAWGEDFKEAGMESLSGAISGFLMSSGGRALMSGYDALQSGRVSQAATNAGLKLKQGIETSKWYQEGQRQRLAREQNASAQAAQNAQTNSVNSPAVSQTARQTTADTATPSDDEIERRIAASTFEGVAPKSTEQIAESLSPESGKIGGDSYEITNWGNGEWTATLYKSSGEEITLDGEYSTQDPRVAVVEAARGDTSQKTSAQTVQNTQTAQTEQTPAQTAAQTETPTQVPENGATQAETPSATQSNEVQASVKTDKATWENWKTERNLTNRNMDAKPLSAIIEEIGSFFGLHVGTGNVQNAKANATYNNRDHDIRSRIANNVPSISHELGHHIDRLHGITKNASAEVKAELEEAYSREYADDTYAESKHASEGFAQFLKYYLTNAEQAINDFPALSEAFFSSLTEQEQEFVRKLADEVNSYMSLAPEDRPSSVVLPGEKNDSRRWQEKAARAADRFIQNWLDRFQGIKRAEYTLGGDGGVYHTVRGLPYARNVADYCLTHELTNLYGQRVGDSLVDALEGINVNNKEEFRAFGDYLVARHLPERLAQGKRVYADETKNNIEAAKRQIAALDAKYPQFKAAADKVVKFERQLVKTYGVDAGLISAETYKHWREIYPNHVPLNRVMDETGSYGAKRGGEVDSAFKMTAKDGSGRDIVHPVMNIINETVSLVQLAKENQVRLGLRKLAKGQSANAAVMTKVNPQTAETVKAEEIKAEVRKRARQLAGLADETNIDRLLDNLQDFTIFRKGKGGGNVVPVMVNGKSEMWQINDPLLLDSLNNMRPQKMSAILESYGKISRFITQNITGGDIVWSLTRNAPKDQINLFMLMKDKKQALQVLKNEGLAYVNSFLEARGKLDQMNPFAREFYAMGGGRGQSALTQGTDFTRKTARALTGQDKTAKGIGEKILSSPMDLVGFVSDTIEMGPRLATYMAYRQNGYSPTRAFYEAMESTTDFSMQGKISREVNKVVPFFSAGIAGVNRMARYLAAEDVANQGKEARKRAVASRVTTYVVSSFLLTAMQFALNHATKKRKEEYQQVSNYIKNTNWLIPYGNGKFLAIQKSRETNLLSSFFDALLERTVGGDSHAFDEFYGYAVDQIFPGVASDLAKLPENIAKDGLGQGIENSFFSALGSMGLLGVVANLGANKDFRDRPIVSQTYQNMPAREQYNASTSKLAYWIGQAFNISPMKLDYFGKNVLGYMWKYPAQLFPVDPSKADYTLGVKGTYVKDSAYSNDITNRLYDRADASALAAASSSAGPEQKYYKAKDERMTSFYSRFNKLNRDDGSDTARDDRAEMMQFLAAYLTGAEQGEETKAEQFIREACVENDDTSYLPSALPTTIKNGKDEIQLTASQYFYYQTRYMELYYSKIAQRGNLNMSAARKAEICRAASNEAKEQAAKETLRKR